MKYYEILMNYAPTRVRLPTADCTYFKVREKDTCNICMKERYTPMNRVAINVTELGYQFYVKSYLLIYTVFTDPIS